MTRPMRLVAACSNALAGPSRIVAPRAAPRLAVRTIHSSPRPNAAWDKYLPSFMQRRSQPASAPAAPGESASAAEIETSDSTTSLLDQVTQEVAKQSRVAATEHRYTTAPHMISPRKLNMIARQLAGLPVDEAIVQMQFSQKRAAQTWVKSTLALARDHAINKGLSRDRLVVAESWVSKGHIHHKRIDIKGRGRAGRIDKLSARLHVVLRHGMTQSEKSERRFQKEIGLVRSAGLVREDGKLRRKVTSGWAW